MQKSLILGRMKVTCLSARTNFASKKSMHAFPNSIMTARVTSLPVSTGAFLLVDLTEAVDDILSGMYVCDSSLEELDNR